MAEKFISAKLDIVFKKLFAENTDILKEFLSDILDIPIEKINSITVLNPDILPESIGEKYYRLDLLLDLGGTIINVEMQVRSDDYYQDRTLLYWSKMYASQLKSGEEYGELCPCIVINILDFVIFPEHGDYHSEFGVWDMEHNSKLSDKMAIHFFELKKVPQNVDKTRRKELWLQFIKADDKEAFDMLEKTNVTGIQKGVEAIYKMSADERTKELIRMREKALHDEASLISSAERRGRADERKSLASKWRRKGYTEEQIKELLEE